MKQIAELIDEVITRLETTSQQTGITAKRVAEVFLSEMQKTENFEISCAALENLALERLHLYFDETEDDGLHRWYPVHRWSTDISELTYLPRSEMTASDRLATLERLRKEADRAKKYFNDAMQEAKFDRKINRQFSAWTEEQKQKGRTPSECVFDVFIRETGIWRRRSTS